METKTENGSVRVLELFNRLQKGELLVKVTEAQNYGVSPKTITRDFNDIRAMLSNDAKSGRILSYDKKAGGYRLQYDSDGILSGSEILAVCKILLDSRSMVKEEMLPIIDKLVNCCAPLESSVNTAKLKDLIANEKTYYIEPHHKKAFIKKMWDIGIAVEEHRIMKISYTDAAGQTKQRKILPMGIMFSEYYFYLPSLVVDEKTARTNGKISVKTQANLSIDRTYRIDRITDYTVLKETFTIPYTKEFDETNFRKCNQFMFGGPLQTVIFKYHSRNIEHVLDRLPSAIPVNQSEDGSIWTVKATVFGGKGLQIWIDSQGELISDVTYV